MKIIAFGNKRFTGKDTALKFLTTHLRLTNPGVNVRKTMMAEKLKDICHQLYSWAGLKSAEYYEKFPFEKDIVLPIIKMSPREIWIKVGTKALREQVYEDTWINYLMNNLPVADYLLIQDLRFPNEANAILARGGFIFRIDCKEETIRNRMGVSKGDTTSQDIVNIADTPLDNYDRWTDVITNDGTLKEFNSSIIYLADRYLKKEVA